MYTKAVFTATRTSEVSRKELRAPPAQPRAARHSSQGSRPAPSWRQLCPTEWPTPALGTRSVGQQFQCPRPFCTQHVVLLGGGAFFATEKLYLSQGCVISLWPACPGMRPTWELQRWLLAARSAHSWLYFCPTSWVCPDLAVPYPPITQSMAVPQLGRKGPQQSQPCRAASPSAFRG